MKRGVFAFMSAEIRPAETVTAFGLADDYSFGILQSGLHWLWFVTKCGKLKSDFRYSIESVFDTFPWPQYGEAVRASAAAGNGACSDAFRRSPRPEERASAAGGPAWGGKALTTSLEGGAASPPCGADAEAPANALATSGLGGVGSELWSPAPPLSPAAVARIAAVAAAGCEVRRIRAEALPKIKGGLRALYRTLELPGKNPLKDAHAALDAAVLAAYGFDPQADLLAQLLALNLDVAARISRNEPVTAPGLPPGFPDSQRLITPDCIQPPEG
jgi:hypothetical protein